MGLIAVPNMSEGRDVGRLQVLAEAIRAAGGTLVDVHSDPTHDRSVFTVAGSPDELVSSMVALARASMHIDLTQHQGVHPRIGALDVCPIVPHGSPLAEAIPVAIRTGREISGSCGLPVYLYGAAASRPEARELPDLRRGGLKALKRRARNELPPDFGPREIDDRTGVVCVGARDVLIAFNVWIGAPEETAKAIADEVRTSGGGLPGVRALGLRLEEGVSQVSMNLTAPRATGVDAVYEKVKAAALRRGAEVIATELVGVPPQRFMPDPQREAARLLRKPGRSLELALAG